MMQRAGTFGVVLAAVLAGCGPRDAAPAPPAAQTASAQTKTAPLALSNQELLALLPDQRDLPTGFVVRGRHAYIGDETNPDGQTHGETSPDGCVDTPDAPNSHYLWPKNGDYSTRGRALDPLAEAALVPEGEDQLSGAAVSAGLARETAGHDIVGLIGEYAAKCARYEWALYQFDPPIEVEARGWYTVAFTPERSYHGTQAYLFVRNFARSRGPPRRIATSIGARCSRRCVGSLRRWAIATRASGWRAPSSGGASQQVLPPPQDDESGQFGLPEFKDLDGDGLDEVLLPFGGGGSSGAREFEVWRASGPAARLADAGVVSGQGVFRRTADGKFFGDYGLGGAGLAVFGFYRFADGKAVDVLKLDIRVRHDEPAGSRARRDAALKAAGLDPASAERAYCAEPWVRSVFGS